MPLAMLLSPIPLPATVLVVLSIGLLALRAALLKVRELFFVVEYSHAEND